jgi:hypothetical protein
MKRQLIVGALLCAAPLFPQQTILKQAGVRAPAVPRRVAFEPLAKGRTVNWFTLRETPRQIQASMGEPSMVAEAGSQWISWQYRVGENVEHDDFSHQLIFERGSGRLVSVTRNYEAEQDVAALFPAAETKLYYFPDERAPQLTIRLRRLPDDRILTALGARGATSQLVLMRPEQLPVLFPWIAR